MKANNVRAHAGRQILILAACIHLCSSTGIFQSECNAAAFTALLSTTLYAQGNQNLQDLIKTLQNGNASDRQRTAIALGNSGDARAVAPLIKALNDEDDFVRDFAVKALGNLKDGRAFEPLVKALNDRNLLVRRSAALSLGSLGDPRAVDVLVKILDSEDYLMRRSAAKALGEIKDTRAIDPLLKVLGSSDSYVRDGAVIALEEIGAPAVPKLVDQLGNWTMGPRVAEILKDIGWKASSDQEKVLFNAAMRNRQFLVDNWEVSKKVLINEARSASNSRVQNAILVLISVGRNDAVAELAEILDSKGSTDIADAFVNSGNDSLAKAAQDWARKNGTELGIKAPETVVAWGGMK